MPITSLENLDLNSEKSGEKKIIPSEPEGAELSTFSHYTDDVSGELVATDKKYSRLAIGQKSGMLGEAKGMGNLILNKEIVLAPYGQIMHVLVLKIRKLYQERRPYDPNSTTLPRTFNTAKEAVAAGFSTEWGPPEEKIALPIAQIVFFIPAPQSLDPEIVEQEFPYEFSGLKYTAAGFITSPTGYAETAKPIFTALDTPKVKELGLRSVRWSARVDKRMNPKNSWYVLKLTAVGFNAPELMAYSKTVLP
jgi:hypothetical protein